MINSKAGSSALFPTRSKTGATVWHPLEESADGGTVQFYADAEAVLAQVPRRGVPMILKLKRDGTAMRYGPKETAQIVRQLRDRLGLPATFTLDACRHGGMTEMEEAELTDGQGRALSGHRTQGAYAGYAKRTLARALPATRKRYAHLIAAGTLREHLFRMRRGTAFRMTCRTMTQRLPNPLRCLTYAGAPGECPERQRELTVKLAVSRLVPTVIPKNRREMPPLQSIGWPPFRNIAASRHATRYVDEARS
jgi:hypothetical protein